MTMAADPTPVPDRVAYYGLEYQSMLDWSGDEPNWVTIYDAKVVGVFPHRLCHQPVIFGPRGTADVSQSEHRLRLVPRQHAVVNACLRLWGISEITLPKGYVTPERDGLAWMLALGQLYEHCYRVRFLAYALTEACVAPPILDSAPTVHFEVRRDA